MFADLVALLFRTAQLPWDIMFTQSMDVVKWGARRIIPALLYVNI